MENEFQANNLKVKTLCLRGSLLKELPSGLDIDVLDLRGSRITTLPNDIKVKNIHIDASNDINLFAGLRLDYDVPTVAYFSPDYEPNEEDELNDLLNDDDDLHFGP